MVNKELTPRAFILVVLATLFTIIATALITQAICRYCGVEAAKELIQMCQKGHPACWPTSLPKEKPKTPVEKAQHEELAWLIPGYSLYLIPTLPSNTQTQ